MVEILLSANIVFFIVLTLYVIWEEVMEKGADKAAGCSCEPRLIGYILDEECPVHGSLEEGNEKGT